MKIMVASLSLLTLVTTVVCQVSTNSPNAGAANSAQQKDLQAKKDVAVKYRLLSEAVKAEDVKKVMLLYTSDIVLIDGDKKSYNRKQLQKKYEDEFARALSISMYAITPKEMKVNGNKLHCISTRVQKGIESAANGKKRRIAISTTSKDSWILGPAGWILQRVEVIPSKSTAATGNRAAPRSSTKGPGTSVID